MLKNKTVKTNFILPLIFFVLAMIYRLCLGSNVVFFVYHSCNSIFPSNTIYTILYYLRIFLSSYALSLALRSHNSTKKLKIISLICLLSIYIEYWLLLFKENIIFSIVIMILTAIFYLKVLYKGNMSRELCFKFNIVLSLYIIIQILLIACSLSLII